MPLPLWRLGALAAAGALVVLAAPDASVALLGVNAALIVLAVVDGVRAVPPARLDVRRHLPAVVRLGQRAEVRWSVTSRSSRRLHVRLADELAPSLRPGDRRARLLVPGGGQADAVTELCPARRGRFAVPGLTLRVEGPWRLVARQARRELPDVVRVYPPLDARREAELQLEAARFETGSRTVRTRGAGTDFDQLREYRIDDDFRRIDWAATARTGRPIVRTYRAERNQTVLLLLDTGRVMAGRVADVPRLDHALDAVLLLTAVATRLGDRAGLVAYAEQVRAVVAPDHRRAQLGRVTEACYVLQPRLVESDHRRAFAATLARFRRRALLVVLTELSEQAVAETLLPAVPLVARTHLVVVGAARDPVVERWARERPTDASTVYRSAAAVQALEERRQVAARLRRLGVVVVDEPPERLAPALTAAYLDIKARARL